MIEDAGGRPDAGADVPETTDRTDADEAHSTVAEGPDAGDTPDGEAGPEGEIEALRQQAEDNHQKYLRAAAELENFRKRAARDVENARRYGLERLAEALLPVKDSLEAGLASAEQADPEALLDGKKATLRLLDAAFEQVGIEELDPEGEPFDPAKHEAMTMAPSDTAEPDTVLTVIQKGYAIHDRLLRPARVIVSQEPPDKES